MNNHGPILCPHCGSQVDHGDAFCDNCGQQLPDVPKETVGISDDKLTRPIGEEFDQSSDRWVSPQTRSPFNPDSPQGGAWSPKKVALIVGGALVVVALVGTGYFYFKGKEPSPSPNGAISNNLSDSSSNVSNPVSVDDPSQPTKEGLLAAPDDNGKIAYFNSYGEKIKAGTYDYGDHFVEGYANVSVNGKWGLIDKSHNVVLDYCAEGVRSVSEGMVPIKIDGKWGYLDLKDINKDKKYTQLVISAEYDDVSEFSNGFVVATQGNRAKFLNKSGSPVFPDLPELEKAWPFSDGVAAVKFAKPSSSKETLGLIDPSGKIIATFSGKSAGKFSDGLMPVVQDGQTWYLDKNLSRVLGPYQYGYSFTRGLAGIYEGNNVGFIDKTGKFVIPSKYESAEYDVRYGVIICIVKDKYMFLDKTGKVIWEGKVIE